MTPDALTAATVVFEISQWTFTILAEILYCIECRVKYHKSYSEESDDHYRFS
jgi:hypothetical protein